MMEVTQNVELRELSTEDDLIRSITELDHKVDKLSSPEINTNMGSRKSTIDEEIHNGLSSDILENNIKATSPIDSIGKSDDHDHGNELPSEHDAGTDLDALLDKISSIVDCDRKDSVDEDDVTMEDSSIPISADIDNITEDNTAIDKAETNVIGAEAKQKEEQENSVEELNSSDLPEVEENPEEKQEENSTETKEKQNINESEIGATVKENVPTDENMLDDETEENTKKDPKITNTKRSQDSNEDVFLDALENISSSDEFEAQGDQKTVETDEPIPNEQSKHDLENITSDESYDGDDKTDAVDEKANGEAPIIDLDSSDDKTIDTPAKEDAAEAETEMEVDKTEEAEKELSVKTLESKSAEADNVSEEKTKTDPEVDKEDPVPSEDKVVEPTEPKSNGVLDDESEKKVEQTEEQATSKPSENMVAETREAESDDEVIFFEPIEKTGLKESQTGESKTEAVKDMPATADKKVEEVVLLSEDEDDQPAEKKPSEESSKSDEKTAPTKPNDSKSNGTLSRDLLADNSDNACDQFEKQKTLEKPKVVLGEDADSNSSNLLQPSHKSRDEAPAEAEADAEPAAEADEGDVEMVADDPEDESEAAMPAVKRLRLSTDDKVESSNSTAVTTASVSTTTNTEEAAPVVAKRSHSLLASSSPAEKEAIPSKKLKTDDSDSNSSNDGTLQIDLDAHDNTQESEESATAATEPAKIKHDEKTESKELEYELKPKPELKSDVKPLRLEFLKSFRKSFDKMTRQDLEELVLQKIVESMLVKSEFSEIRRQIDNQENTLANYRRKIAEVSKQFLDLETVHKRVLKDLETKNAQFTAPVRITRAVGLQVGMALMKKPSEEAARNHASGSHTAGSMSAATATMPTPQKASTSPMRSSMRALPPPRLSPPQHQHQQQLQQQHQLQQQQQQQQQHQHQLQQHQQQQQQHTPPTISTRPYVQTSGGGTPPVRRGCMQKVTPQRPVNNTPSSHQASTSGQGMQRLPNTPNVPTRPMYASKHTGNVTPATAAAVAAAMRARGTTAKPITKDYPSSYMTQKQQQQQQLQQQQQQQQQQSPLPVRIGRSPGKQSININSKARPMPTVSVPMSSATDGGSSGAGYGQPSLAPARPKEKAVIDLTDEDDAAAAAAAAAMDASANARLRQALNVPAKRMQTSPLSGSTRSSGGSVVRVSPMNIPRTNAVARQIVNGPGQRGSTGSSANMQIRSENTPPSGSRARFSHPAPLPLAPVQINHPDWKLPPSRPVIRISLHDTGIVISWTLEDTGSRFAECVTYQIYAYQETINEPSTDSWRHVGDVKAMLLPMAVTLNQFQENQRYFFAVRGVDAHDRYGLFSVPKTW
ncbi:activating transcription factor 7-interacting protein 1 [Drosophila mojavensis]|uniref:activating transcription factor 7-interacting protein 1 n=1 Tax=Drosophila mojavensis TaxID=7230 RepID=UPI00017C9520|nr:activating transcription factor 7-interacting protein 1 [Drosophila mojavensis]XP_032585666.1 activating transcription factor 7-interacting protein 1 [Drosophila mojavensis]